MGGLWPGLPFCGDQAKPCCGASRRFVTSTLWSPNTSSLIAADVFITAMHLVISLLGVVQDVSYFCEPCDTPPTFFLLDVQHVQNTARPPAYPSTTTSQPLLYRVSHQPIVRMALVNITTTLLATLTTTPRAQLRDDANVSATQSLTFLSGTHLQPLASPPP